MISIHLYLLDDDETPIESFYDLPFNPFKLDDEVTITIDELFPKTLAKFVTKESRDIVLEKNLKYTELFNRRTVRLLQEGKYIETNTFDSARIIIEYHCVIVE